MSDGRENELENYVRALDPDDDDEDWDEDRSCTWCGGEGTRGNASRVLSRMLSTAVVDMASPVGKVSSPAQGSR